jgi:hypothetical protein
MKRSLWNAVLAMLATMCASLSASAGPVEHADLIPGLFAQSPQKVYFTGRGEFCPSNV